MIRRIAISFAAMVVVGVAVLVLYQRFSDGPTGPLAGGPFRSGESVAAPVTDWSTLAGDFEFELVGPGTSRTAGGLLVDGTLYITCDLGFVWSRLPPGQARNVLNVIWWFKDWHEQAEADGRVRIRRDGRIYDVNIERVREPALVEGLKTALEDQAREYFAPRDLGPRPLEEPNDIWFFRVAQ